MTITMHHTGPADQADTGISEAKLRGRQSVRTTFRLPVHLIELLAIIAEQFGVKQKSLFDQLVEDNDVLSEVAECGAGYLAEKSERRPKTYVISRQALLALERVAGERQIPRDVLVEISIRRLLPVLSGEREKHSKRAMILRDMEKYLQHGQGLLQRTENLLGRADPVYEMISRMIRLGEEKVSEMGDLVAKGKILEKAFVERFSGGVKSGEGEYESTKLL